VLTSFFRKEKKILKCLTENPEKRHIFFASFLEIEQRLPSPAASRPDPVGELTALPLN